MTEQIKSFIDNLANGNNSEAKEALENILSAKAFEALDTHKKELASGIFTNSNDATEE